MMFRFFVIGVGSVLVILTIARKSLKARFDVPKEIRLRHYAFVSYLVLVNVGGLSQTYWTFRRLFDGNLIGPLEQSFIVIRELPAFIGVAIWVFGAVGQSITVFLTFKVARLNGEYRAILLRFYPMLVAAEGAASLISIRGTDGVVFMPGVAWEYVIAVCLWCLFAWPYLFAYRFYRGALSDVLFAEPASQITGIRAGNDWP